MSASASRHRTEQPRPTGRRAAPGAGGLIARGAAGVVGLVCCAGLWAACGSTASTSSATALTAVCQNVSAVLSDGPDPTADPIDYAEAQMIPLQQIHTSDKSLQSAIDRLDRAYRLMFSTNGAPTAAQAVTKASNRLNTFCPGAAP